MARYRKVDVRVWVDERFRRLTGLAPSGQALWLYLMTNPNTTNVPGLYRAGERAMSEDLGWSLEAFREAFQEVFAEGLAEADWEARVVWLPRAWKYNRPESPNVVKSWRAAWDEIPSCALKLKAYQHLKGFAAALGEGFAKAFAEACGHPSPQPLPNPEQEQEQDPEGSGEGSPPLPPTPPEPLALIPEPAPPKALLVFPIVRGVKSDGASTWKLTAPDLRRLQEGFPDLDVLAECKKALLWTEANSAKRKTATGMLAFLNRWLASTQNNRANRPRNSGSREVAYPKI